MDVTPVRDLGALHVHKGRLWLGVPKGIRKELPGQKWLGLWLAPDGIHDIGGGGLFAKRRVAWDDMTSVVVRLGRWGPRPGSAVPILPDPLPPPSPGDKPPDMLSVEWVGPTRFDRNLTGNFTGWLGEDSATVRHAVEQLPNALRTSPALRNAVISDGVACALLGRLAVAQDIGAVDAVLRG